MPGLSSEATKAIGVRKGDERRQGWWVPEKVMPDGLVLTQMIRQGKAVQEQTPVTHPGEEDLECSNDWREKIWLKAYGRLAYRVMSPVTDIPGDIHSD